MNFDGGIKVVKIEFTTIAEDEEVRKLVLLIVLSLN